MSLFYQETMQNYMEDVKAGADPTYSTRPGVCELTYFIDEAEEECTSTYLVCVVEPGPGILEPVRALLALLQRSYLSWDTCQQRRD